MQHLRHIYQTYALGIDAMSVYNAYVLALLQAFASVRLFGASTPGKDRSKMTAPTLDFEIDQGSDWHLDFTIKRDSGSGAAVADISQATFAGKMRPRADLEPATDITCTVLDATGGIVRLSQSSTTTAGLRAGNQTYDIEITLTDPLYPQKTLRLLSGIIAVKAENTR